MRFIVAIFALTFSASATADEPVDDRKVIYKQRTEIDFEGVELQGELIRPQGALLMDRKRASFHPLIKLRRDFDQEMNRSVDEVK